MKRKEKQEKKGMDQRKKDIRKERKKRKKRKIRGLKKKTDVMRKGIMLEEQ